MQICVLRPKSVLFSYEGERRGKHNGVIGGKLLEVIWKNNQIQGGIH